MSNAAAPAPAAPTYPVYFLSPRDGRWHLQHTFTSKENAVECAKNLVRYASAIVNEDDGTTERQILEVRANGMVST